MNSSDIRRVLMIITGLLWFMCFKLWKESRLSQETSYPKLTYKIRAYTLSREKASKIKSIGRNLNLNSSVAKGTRTIKKFMGYVIIQDFMKTGDSKKVNYINEFLRAKGYNSRVIRGTDERTLSIQVGSLYSKEEDARKITDGIYKEATVTFGVRKYYKSVPYNAFIVIFDGINDRKQAIELRNKIEVICADVEMVSY